VDAAEFEKKRIENIRYVSFSIQQSLVEVEITKRPTHAKIYTWSERYSKCRPALSVAEMSALLMEEDNKFSSKQIVSC